jgi:hypothetical protein
MSVSPRNSYEALTPEMVLEVGLGSFGKGLGSDIIVGVEASCKDQCPSKGETRALSHVDTERFVSACKPAHESSPDPIPLILNTDFQCLE